MRPRPRCSRPVSRMRTCWPCGIAGRALGNLGAMALLALLATGAAVVAVLFGRRVRYALHDFHHVFPRGLGQWQSIAVAAAILLMPILLGLGVVPVLLVLFGAIALYLS